MPDDPRLQPEAAVAPCRVAAEAGVQLTGVSQSYGKKRVLHGIDLTLEDGGFLALVGPSGCGKSTLLKLLAGLLAPDAGVIRIGGLTVADRARTLFVPPERRDLGMVFQDYALWPHLRVRDNVGFPLEMRGVASPTRRQRVDEALAQVGLAGFGDSFPGRLSGGQQQRVALARAIVARPKLILFDEPMSNLDLELRESLGMEMAGLCRSLRLTAIYVTHDLGEAFALADRVAVMRDGAILQTGEPEQLVAEPASEAVADFLKLGTVVPARLEADHVVIGETVRLVLRDRSARAGPGKVLLPTRALAVARPGQGDLSAVVMRRRFHGHSYAVALRIAADLPDLHLVTDQRLELGARIAVAVDTGQLRWFPAAS